MHRNDYPSIALSKRRFLFVFFGGAITVYANKGYPFLTQHETVIDNLERLDSNSGSFNPDITIHSLQINGWYVSERDIQQLMHLKEIS